MKTPVPKPIPRTPVLKPIPRTPVPVPKTEQEIERKRVEELERELDRMRARWLREGKENV